MSPLLNEETHLAKHRYAQPKPEQDPESMTDFQKQLALNPHAQALATPIRLCQLTLAHLPIHFLTPFTTTVSRPPNNPTQRIKAQLKPGPRPHHSDQETLPSTSYMLNRFDATRHLQRQNHWTNLVTERQRANLGRILKKTRTGDHKFVREQYVWEDAVEPVTALLEGEVVAALEAVTKEETQLGQHGAREVSASVGAESPVACILTLSTQAENESSCRDKQKPASDIPVFDLAPLLSDANIQAVRASLGSLIDFEISTKLPPNPATTKVMVALDKLRAFKTSTSIMKRMPMVHNPQGTRQRLQEERAREQESSSEEIGG